MDSLKENDPMPMALCCMCGTSIIPNEVNMCLPCVSSRTSIDIGIPKQVRISSCKTCKRFLSPPNTWVPAELESKELMALLIRKMKPTLSKVRLVDAKFVWTEPHSQRIKVKMSVQKEVLRNSVLQKDLIVEFQISNEMCQDCRRIEAKDYWRGCVQVRQKCEFKKTLFYLEQVVSSYGSNSNCSFMKPVSTGIDFFFSKLQDARKFLDYVCSLFPCRYKYSKELVTHDTKNNTYDYKHTFAVDVAPLCHGDVICLPKKLAQSLGNISQLVICTRISNVISLIDPSTLLIAELSASAYWRYPFQSLCHSKYLEEYYVIDVESTHHELPPGHGMISKNHILADVWVTRSDLVGQDNETVCIRSHLGHLLKPGDYAKGINFRTFNVNSSLLDGMNPDYLPDVILVSKVHEKNPPNREPHGILDTVIMDGIIDDLIDCDVEDFAQQVREEDKLKAKFIELEEYDEMLIDSNDEVERNSLHRPSLRALMKDMDLNADVEMSE